MPPASTSTSACTSTSPRVLTPSQAASLALTAASSSTPNIRGPSGSIAPLQRIECVRVAKKLRRNGHRLYVVAVYLQRSEAHRRLSECVYKVSPASKLSPEAMSALMMAEREPNYSVEHRFSEFRELRDSVAGLVRASEAHAKSCAACQDLLRVMLKHQNWTVKRMFGSSEQRFALLTAFLNDLLALTASAGERATSGSSSDEDKDCRVREQVAGLLQKFLKRRYSDSTGII
ncbi:hypothetical protein PRIC1_001302 [Phytophthora ramorum]